MKIKIMSEIRKLFKRLYYNQKQEKMMLNNDSKENTNNNILLFCQQYINSSDTNYAILLTGEWGCGKTYFWQMLQKSIETQFELKTIYISLFGVKTIEQIDDKLFEAAHATLCKNQKGIVVTYKLIRTAIKNKYKIDTNDIIGAVNLKECLNNKYNVMVLDDIERSSLSVDDFFGYVESLLYNGIKIILIGNENELKFEENGYIRQKEKVIGHTFEIEPDYNEAISYFIGQHKESSGFMNDNKKIIISMMKKLKFSNFRIIEQVLWEWDCLYSNINSEIKSKEEYMSNIFEQFVFISVQIKLGILSNSKIKEYFFDNASFSDEVPLIKYIWYLFKQKHLTLEEWINKIDNIKTEQQKSSEIKNFTAGVILYGSINLMTELISIIIKCNFFNRILINQYLQDDYKMKYVPLDEKDVKELLVQVVKHQMLPPNCSIKGKIDELLINFHKGAYLEVQDILDCIGILTELIEQKVLPKEFDLKWLDGEVQKFISRNKDKINKSEKIISNPLKFKISQRIVKQIEDIAADNFIIMLRKKETFIQIIQGDGFYKREIPIISKIDVDLVYQWINEDIKLSNSLIDFLETRYGKNIVNYDMEVTDYEDLRNVKKIRDKYYISYRKSRHQYKPMVTYYKYMYEQYTSLIKYINKEKSKKAQVVTPLKKS